MFHGVASSSILMEGSSLRVMEKLVYSFCSTNMIPHSLFLTHNLFIRLYKYTTCTHGYIYTCTAQATCTCGYKYTCTAQVTCTCGHKYTSTSIEIEEVHRSGFGHRHQNRVQATQKRMHFLGFFFFTWSAALVAVSKTSLTPSLLLAEHSR